MFDAGEGAQMAYLKAGLGWNKKMKIFVTHMHGDHCLGIPGLLQTMSMRQRTSMIEIFGPAGIEEFIYANMKALGFGPPFPVLITAVEEGLIVDEPAYSVYAHDANHTVPAFSYKFTEKDKPGRFRPEAAGEMGVPKGRLWGMLQRGEVVTVDGREILPSQVMGERRRGRTVGVSGDTSPTEGLKEFFRGCDYLVFDSTFSHELRERARETGHSTSTEAATLARDAGVRNLILTHFSARYPNEAVLVKEARMIHDSVLAARDLGEVRLVSSDPA